jgi:hypothetical protein
MPVVLLQLPKTEIIPDSRPRECPYCKSPVLQRWGRVTKPIKGRTGSLAVIYRFRCEECKKTFRHYPKWIDRSGHTHSIRQLAGLLSALGLSNRTIADLFKDIGVDLSYSTIWREAKILISHLDMMNIDDYDLKPTIDKEYLHNVSSKFGIVVTLGLGYERYVVLGTLDEPNPTIVVDWMQTLVNDSGIKVSRLGTGTLDYMHSLSQLN